MMRNRKVNLERDIAFALDFDGTFAPTEDLNRQKAEVICKEFMGWNHTPPGLATVDAYLSGIREHGLEGYYLNVIGISLEEFRELNKQWAERIIQSDILVYDGIKDMMNAIVNYNKGIFSLQGTGQIKQILRNNGLLGIWDGSPIIGYDVHRTIKSDPASLLQCIEGLEIVEGVVYVVGDQEVDVETVENAQLELPRITFRSIGVEYGSPNGGIDNWKHKPDHRASHPMDIPRAVVKDFPYLYELSEARLLERI